MAPAVVVVPQGGASDREANVATRILVSPVLVGPPQRWTHPPQTRPDGIGPRVRRSNNGSFGPCRGRVPQTGITPWQAGREIRASYGRVGRVLERTHQTDSLLDSPRASPLA